MYKIKILTVGKNKEAWLEMALKEYQKRLKSSLQIESIFAKDDPSLSEVAEKEKNVVGLDVEGIQMDSKTFSTFLLDRLEQGGSKLTVVIGGALGLPAALKSRFPLVSLSPMTFTHQIVRLILVEQIYRALEIAKNSPYHK